MIRLTLFLNGIFIGVAFDSTFLTPPSGMIRRPLQHPDSVTTRWYRNDDHIDFSDKNVLFSPKLVPYKVPSSKTSKYDEKWNNKYQQLKEYYDHHGHCDVPSNYKDGALSRWISCQRRAFKLNKDTMTNERIRALQEINFIWSKYKTKTPSNTNTVPTFHTQFTNSYAYDEEVLDLPGTLWLQNLGDLRNFEQIQQTQYEEMSHSENLKQDRGHAKDFLKEKQGKRRRTPWINRYNELKKFHDTHGHCMVPQHYGENPDLGKWVKAQRRQYKLKVVLKQPSSMTESRISKLNSLGFAWDMATSKIRKDDSHPRQNDIAVKDQPLVPFDFENKSSKELHTAWIEHFKEYR